MRTPMPARVRSGRRWALVLVLVSFFGLPPTLHAQTPLDDEVRAVAAGLRCPVCQNLSVADSPSELAREMRGVIREQLNAGKTPDEVRAYFVAKYGDWVLLAPRPRGLNMLVWVGPFVAALAGAAVAIRAVRRWSRRAARPERAPADAVAVARLRAEVGRDREPLSPAAAESLSPLQLERERLYDALREIEFDHRAGKLSAADYEALRADYEARALVVLDELDRETAAAAPRRRDASRSRAARATRSAGDPRRVAGRRTWRLVAGSAFLLVFGVSLGYALTTSLRPRVGEKDSLTGDFLTGTGPGGIMPGSRDAAMTLAKALDSGRAAYQRQDWRAAIDAFKQAIAIDAENAEAHAFLALILAHAGHGDEAVRLADRALSRTPTYPFGLWVKGITLFEGKQDYAGAIEAWERLMAQPLGQADADRVAQAIVEARTRLAASPGPEAPATKSPKTITGTITVAPALRSAVSPTAVLYVIARQGDGPPLAVKRIANPSFPLSFALSEEDRMVGRRPFEGEATLVARLKRDGTAGPAGPGDIEGRSQTPVKVGARSVAIVLDKAY